MDHYNREITQRFKPRADHAAPATVTGLVAAAAAQPEGRRPLGAVFDARGLFPDRLTHDDRARLRSCPCRERPDSDEQLSSFASLCLPVDFAGKKPRKEVFAFSVATDERWKHYDWDQEGREDRGQAQLRRRGSTLQHFSPPNLGPVPGVACARAAARAGAACAHEERAGSFRARRSHGSINYISRVCALLTPSCAPRPTCMQITFDVPWAPRGVDGRYYPWRELADAADFLFVMSYDMRSQVYDACVAGANAPLALVEQGLQEFLLGFDIAPDKLVLGVPWYGYDYPCLEQQGAIAIDDASRCRIRPVPFFGAPCSDAAGGQIDYADVRRLVKSHGLVEQWDPTTQTPFVWYAPPAEEGSPPSRRLQIWFDNPRSLRAKYQLVRELRLRGVGMWNADTLDYSSDSNDTRLMWSSLAEAFTPNRENALLDWHRLRTASERASERGTNVRLAYARSPVATVLRGQESSRTATYNRLDDAPKLRAVSVASSSVSKKVQAPSTRPIPRFASEHEDRHDGDGAAGHAHARRLEGHAPQLPVAHGRQGAAVAAHAGGRPQLQEARGLRLARGARGAQRAPSCPCRPAATSRPSACTSTCRSRWRPRSSACAPRPSRSAAGPSASATGRTARCAASSARCRSSAAARSRRR
ncbi:hypothetical protein ON010_g15103 [Phytophthora cinnamomi]|nr:hypothetical protein ON010_g15103 [Phytophthora cinnamomi]